MKIAISGFVGVGKTASAAKVRELLGKKGIKTEIILPTFKDIAKEKGISLMDVQKMAAKDPSFDKAFDEQTLKMVSKAKNAIIASWLAIWIIKDADLKVYLYAPFEEKVRRIASRDGWNEAKARKHIAQREEMNRKRYKKVYGVDITDYSTADVCINTSKLDIEGVARTIVSALEIRKKI
jgi:cytidylate kinase